jgi:hypothetical protein
LPEFPKNFEHVLLSYLERLFSSFVVQPGRYYSGDTFLRPRADQWGSENSKWDKPLRSIPSSYFSCSRTPPFPLPFFLHYTRVIVNTKPLLLIVIIAVSRTSPQTLFFWPARPSTVFSASGLLCFSHFFARSDSRDSGVPRRDRGSCPPGLFSL